MIDVVVVRVLFLEPGNKVSVSDVDNGICQIGGDYYTGEDMFEHGFIRWSLPARSAWRASLPCSAIRVTQSARS